MELYHTRTVDYRIKGAKIVTVTENLMNLCHSLGASSPNVLRLAYSNNSLFTLVDFKVLEDDVVLARHKDVTIITDPHSKPFIDKKKSLAKLIATAK